MLIIAALGIVISARYWVGVVNCLNTTVYAFSYKYGFILRYPKGKENITGYTYESWHYRYVGEKAASYIHDTGITFDEYYAYFISGEH